MKTLRLERLPGAPTFSDTLERLEEIAEVYYLAGQGGFERPNVGSLRLREVVLDLLRGHGIETEGLE